MKKSQLLAILALVCALGLATPALLGASADDDTPAENASTSETTTETSTDMPVAGGDVTEPAEEAVPSGEVGTYEALQAAVANPKITKITLTGDIEATSDIVINRDIELDLGGFRLSSQNENANVVYVTKGKVTISHGTIEATGRGGVSIWIKGSTDYKDTQYSVVTVNSDVILKANTNNADYGLGISHNNGKAYGVQVDLYGTIEATSGIYINGNIQDSNNAPVVTVYDGARINASSEGHAIYAAGFGRWNFGRATVSAGTGIGIKAGEIAFNDTTIIANGAKQDNLGLENNSIDASGAVFQIEDNPNYAKGVKITVNGGVYQSQNYSVFYQYPVAGAKTRAAGSEPQITIYGGTFTAANNENVFSGVPVDEVTITGGSFSNTDALAYITSDLKLVKDSNGNWVVARNDAPSQPSGGDQSPEDPGDNVVTDEPGQKPTTPKPTTPDAGANFLATEGGKTSIFTAVAVGILLVIGIWARYSYRHIRANRLATARKTARSSSRSTQSRSGTKSTKTAKSTVKRANSTKSSVAKRSAARKTASKASSRAKKA